MTPPQNAFLQMAVPLAQATERKYGVPASITLAQAVLESSNVNGWGQSQLAHEYNNFFGVKYAALKGTMRYVEMPTHEYVDGMRKLVMDRFVRYDDPADSFEDHARLLATAPRYRRAMQVRNSPGNFAIELQRAGYSTNPNYSRIVMGLVMRYDLMQYDAEPDDPAAAKEKVA